MSKVQYDVVVIGSGIGGLCAGALLAHHGYKTLVAEKLPRIGGRAGTIEYEGYKLTTGAMSWTLAIGEVFKEVGKPFDLRIPKDPIHYFYKGKPYPLPEKGKIRAALEKAIGKEEADKIMDAIRKGCTWMEPSDTISVREWIMQFTQNEEALGPFRGNYQIDHMTAGELIKIFKKMGPTLVGHPPPGGNITLLNELAEVIRSNGGLWVKAPARKILVQEGIAKGVIIEKKDEKVQVEVSCQAVISNAGPKKTVELAKAENFDKGYIREMQETVRPVPFIEIQIGSDRPLLEFGADAEVMDSRRLVWLVVPTIDCPELAPPGKHILLTGAYLAPHPPYDLKEELELNLMDLNDLIPGWREGSEILKVAFYVGDEYPCFRSWHGCMMPQKTPILNLYNVGDGVCVRGNNGMPGSVETAQIVAEDVRKRIKPL
jgi:phytoene dehydrogenase-like protein